MTVSVCVPQVELIVYPSDDVIPKLRAEFGLERLDFVFMDHWKKCYAPDLQVTMHSRELSSEVLLHLVKLQSKAF